MNQITYWREYSKKKQVNKDIVIKSNRTMNYESTHVEMKEDLTDISIKAEKVA